jgi:hypothetical protein
VLTAIARDLAGNTTTSAAVTVNVTAPNTPPAGTITAPTGNLTILAGDSVTFQGSASDPDGHTPLTFLWTFGGAVPNATVEDPGGILFANPGVYTVSFTVRDSQGLADPTPDTRTITVNAPGGSLTTEVRITNGNDDAEEEGTGTIVQNPDLDMVIDSGPPQAVVGVRFPGVNVPQGAVILNAWVQFLSDESQSEATSLTIQGEDVNGPDAFGTSPGDLSSRIRTSASVSWSPAAWTAGAAGPAQRTPNLAPVIQELVARPGWVPGDPIVLLITGSGKRTAESYEGNAGGAPLLHIEYTGGTVDTVPPAPPTNLKVNPS